MFEAREVAMRGRSWTMEAKPSYMRHQGEKTTSTKDCWREAAARSTAGKAGTSESWSSVRQKSERSVAGKEEDYERLAGGRTGSDGSDAKAW